MKPRWSHSKASFPGRLVKKGDARDTPLQPTRPGLHTVRASDNFRTPRSMAAMLKKAKFLSVAVLFAHSWYPAQCCGGAECRPVPCEEVHPVQPGYEYRGRTFLTATPSPDWQCHACFQGPVNHCLFIPMGTT
jgi:hypothetical protein